MMPTVGLILFAILCVVNPYLWIVPITLSAIWAWDAGGWALGAYCTVAVLIYAGLVARARGLRGQTARGNK
jgi:hypothetical protein